jgi:transcription elongation factor Elf1
MNARTTQLETRMTLSFDCPWCGGTLDATVDAPTVRCAACAITVDLADPIPVVALASIVLASPAATVAVAA